MPDGQREPHRARDARAVPAGQLGTSGSVAWDFNHVGIIEAERATADADPELAAIEAGAQDFEAGGDEEGTTVFWTDPTDLDLVSRALPPTASRC